MSEADDPAPVPQRRGQGFAQGDPDVLDRVMEIDVGVAARPQIEPEAGMGGEGLQHVGEEAVGDFDIARAAVQVEGKMDLRLFRGALDL